MKVSVVIPTFNRRAYLRRSVDSALSQTVPVDEVIIVDDEHSTDRIEEAVEAFHDSRVRVVKQGGGLSGARRRGVQEARGEWIAFLDSDDEWTSERNRQLLDAAALLPADVAWIFGNMRVVTDEGSTTLYEEFGLSVTDCPQVFEDTLSVHYPFQFGLLQGSLIRRSVLLELNCFSEGLQHSEDLLAGFQVARHHRFAAIPFVVGSYFRTSDLAANSALLKGLSGPDYFRARVLAFASVIESGRRRPWNMRYAHETRGLYMALAKQGRASRRLALQQFRYGGVSAKGIAFLCAAILGRRGIQAWSAIAKLRRRHLHSAQTKGAASTGFQSYVESVAEKT